MLLSNQKAIPVGMKRIRFLSAVIVVLLLYAACGANPTNETGSTPIKLDDGWDVASPVEFGADMSLLDSMVALTRTGVYSDIHSILVVKRGVLTLERYFGDNDANTLHEIRSATKSIGSILVGIAIDNGYISSENEPIHKFFANDYEPAGGWTEEAREVQIRHLLSMMSGYDCDDLATDFACEHAMHASDDWVRYSIELPFACSPGTRWAYNSSSLILVGEAVARASGLKLKDFADRYLFKPLGVHRFRWQFSPKGHAWIGGGARMTPREMAKIGQLMLNRGVWKGKRILSEEWIDKSTMKQGEMLGGVDYGYLWQVGQAYIGLDRVAAFWASGNGGQYIVIIPKHQMVIVFTGGNYNSDLASQPFQMLTRYILPAFIRPDPLDVVTLSARDMERLEGTYRLDFDHSATTTVAVRDGTIRLRSPDGELIDLVAHSPMFFTGESGYGPLTVVFDTDSTGVIVTQAIYGDFQRFVFERIRGQTE